MVKKNKKALVDSVGIKRADMRDEFCTV